MFFDREMVGKVLLGIMMGAGGMQLLYYWLVFRRIAFYKPTVKAPTGKPVSVIVCARNESANLRRHLPLLLDQDYPDFEVIVVNDCSWDDSSEYLDELAKSHPRLKIVTIKEQERYSHGKKFAITLGIKAASHDRLLFTDADCWPSGRMWLSGMEAAFTTDAEIVLGYGAYQREPGLLNKLIRFDTVMIAMQYLSFALGKNPYMGVGRNLAYRKTLFFRNKGFARHNHLRSGDDDLLVNETATPSNTVICFHPDVFTISTPKASFGAWFRQKKRHVSTSGFYRSGHRVQLGVIGASGWLFMAATIALALMMYRVPVVSMIFVAVFFLKLPIFALAGAKFREKDLILLFPFLELLHYVLQPLFFIAQALSKNKTWK